jgi:hypothetical protein
MDVLSGVRDNWFNVAASTLLVFAATCSGSAEDNKLTGVRHLRHQARQLISWNSKMAMLSQPR